MKVKTMYQIRRAIVHHEVEGTYNRNLSRKLIRTLGNIKEDFCIGTGFEDMDIPEVSGPRTEFAERMHGVFRLFEALNMRPWIEEILV